MKAINSYTKNNFTVLLIKNSIDTFGGFYSVELTHKDKIINDKDGLCFDAANDYFFKTVNKLNKLAK
jgi:hypothetical protein